MKKTWESPKLIILVRGKPEEAIAVLLVCKGDDESGPNTYKYWCMMLATPCAECSRFTNT
jgi:hypothetical protein